MGVDVVGAVTVNGLERDEVVLDVIEPSPLEPAEVEETDSIVSGLVLLASV